MNYNDILIALELLGDIESKTNTSGLIVEISTTVKKLKLSDNQLLGIARKLVYIKQWQLAEEIILLVSEEKERKAQTLALLAEKLSIEGFPKEAERILALLPSNLDLDSKLSKIDALISIVAFYINNERCEEALKVLIPLDKELLNMDRSHREQAEIIANVGELWNCLTRPQKATYLWKKAIAIANKEYDEYKDISRMCYEIRQSYKSIFLSILRTGRVNLAKKLIKLITDQEGKEQVLETIHKFMKKEE